MRRWLVPGFFLIGAALTAVGAGRLLAHTFDHPDVRHALLFIYAALRTAVAAGFALFTVERPQPHRRARDPLAYVACAAAMAAVVLIHGPSGGAPTWSLIAGEALAVLACAWLLASVLALGRCFGVLPEARGLVRRGPYRFVRHPVYLGEIVAVLGLTIASPLTWNAAVLGALVAAQVVRMSFEEHALMSAFPEYRGYADKTGRLLPRIRVHPRTEMENAS
jgi:protein-S-isoprenylcysteine O-methyltransferase Ste14